MGDSWSCVIRIKSNEGQRSHLIAKQTFSVGRAQEADIPILSSGVSRMHLSVEIRGDQIWLTDQKSANGTFVNGNRIDPLKAVSIATTDIVRLGNTPEEFHFQSIPLPFEMMSVETKQKSLVGSMEELAKQVESKAKEKYEAEIQRARLASEQLLAEAKREAEVLKTQALLEAQSKRQELETELARIKQEALSVAAQEKLAAKKEADRMIAEAQKRIQKDYEDSSDQMQARLSTTQEKCMHMLAEAETKAQTVLSEAQSEASRLRREAAEEARSIHQEALRKSNETLTAVQEKIQQEIQVKRKEILDRARVEAEEEKERLLSEAGPRIESLRAQLKDHEQKLKVEEDKLHSARVDLEKLESEKETKNKEIKSLEQEVEKTRALIARTEEFETKRAQAESEFKQFNRKREEGVANIDRELKELREKALMEFDLSKRNQEQELAKLRLKATEDIKKLIEQKEEEYDRTLHLRAVELTQKLHDKLVPKLETWSKDPDTAASSMRQVVESAVQDCLLKESTTFQASSAVDTPMTDTEAEDRKKKRNFFVGVAAIAALVVVGVYWREIFQLLKDQQKDSYASTVMERRKSQSIFSPEQTDEFRASYVDNVLYMKNYYETKMDPKYQERWTLRLNDLDLLRTIGIGEEDIIKFIAKEITLIRRLGTLRDSIDAVYLNEGLQRMKSAESEDIKEMKAILNGEAGYEKLRSVEEEFLKEYLKEKR